MYRVLTSNSYLQFLIKTDEKWVYLSWKKLNHIAFPGDTVLFIKLSSDKDYLGILVQIQLLIVLLPGISCIFLY